MTAFVLLSGVLAGCSTTQPTTAHYRGDSVYGDDGRQMKDKKKKKGAGKDEKGGSGHPRRQRIDPGLLARARGIANPMERALVEEAAGWLGTPYVYGGASRDGADCSGFVMEVYLNVLGVKLPRTSADQSRWCAPVAPEKMHPGDLVFFSADSARVSHVGMFIGEGKMIHASSSRGVMVSALDNPYWLARFHSTGRVASAETAWRKQKGASSSQEPLVASRSGKKNKKSGGGDSIGRNSGGQLPTDSSVSSPDNAGKAAGAGSTEILFDLDLAITQKADSIFNTQIQH